MGKSMTIREATMISGMSSGTIRHRLRSDILEGERVETAQGYVWHVDFREDADVPPTHGEVAGMLVILRQQLEVKDDQIARQARMMQAMRGEHAREVEQSHIFLQTSHQNKERLLSVTVPDAVESRERVQSISQLRASGRLLWAWDAKMSQLRAGAELAHATVEDGMMVPHRSLPRRRSTYQPLLDHLATSPAETLTLSFAAIEAIIDRPLAVSVQVAPSFWTSTTVPFARKLHALGWRAHLDVPAHTVAFWRIY